MKKQSKLNIEKLVKIAILGTLSSIVMLFEFPLPIAPPFYEMDFSEVVVMPVSYTHLKKVKKKLKTKMLPKM